MMNISPERRQPEAADSIDSAETLRLTRQFKKVLAAAHPCKENL